MTLKEWLFGGKISISELQLKMAEKIKEEMMRELAGIQAENVSLKSQNSQQIETIANLNLKLREQNEADLLLELKKIEKRIIEGEKRVDIDTQRLSYLQGVQNSYNRNHGLSGLSSLLGAAGQHLGKNVF